MLLAVLFFLRRPRCLHQAPLQWVGWGGWGKVCSWVCGLALLPVMVAARPQLSYLCPVIRLSCSMLLLLRVGCLCPPVLRAAERVHCNPIPPLLPICSCPCEFGEGEGKPLCICGFVFCLIIATTRPQLPHFCIPSLPCTGFCCSVYWSLRRNVDSDSVP